MTNFVNLVRSLLMFEPGSEIAIHKAARNVLVQFRSETLTLHALDEGRGVLALKVARGVPPPVLGVIREIPVGKGIAGECAAKNEAVTICNLQTDESGVARPGAKQTGLGGTVCVPVRDEAGKVVGTLGIGTTEERAYTPEETRDLQRVANAFAPFLSRLPVSVH